MRLWTVILAATAIAVLANPADAQQRICQHGVCVVIHEYSVVNTPVRKRVELHRSPHSSVSPVEYFLVRIEGGNEMTVRPSGRGTGPLTIDLNRNQRNFTVVECYRGGSTFARCGRTASFSIPSAPPPPPPPNANAHQAPRPAAKGPPIRMLGKLRKTTTAKGDVDIYNSPIPPRRVIGMMRGGTSAKIVASHPDGWCKLGGIANGADGWVAFDHLTVCP